MTENEVEVEVLSELLDLELEHGSEALLGALARFAIQRSGFLYEMGDFGSASEWTNICRSASFLVDPVRQSQ